MPTSLDIPGADLPWLRRILAAPVVLDPPPLTLGAALELRRRTVIRSEHGVLRARRERTILRRLDKIEAEIRASENGWCWPRSTRSNT